MKSKGISSEGDTQKKVEDTSFLAMLTICYGESWWSWTTGLDTSQYCQMSNDTKARCTKHPILQGTMSAIPIALYSVQWILVNFAKEHGGLL